MHRGNSYLNEHCDSIIGSQFLFNGYARSGKV